MLPYTNFPTGGFLCRVKGCHYKTKIFSMMEEHIKKEHNSRQMLLIDNTASYDFTVEEDPDYEPDTETDLDSDTI